MFSLCSLTQTHTHLPAGQDDVLYESLTVHETLLYAGLLRLPRGMAAAEKRRRVEGVMRGLGLARSRDTIIGGFFRRGISGAWVGGGRGVGGEGVGGAS